MAVWDDLVGQERVSEQLARRRPGRRRPRHRRGGRRGPPPEASTMTHAWLFTGPPGSGRTTAARAFAAALQCVSPDRALGGSPGCGFCDGCHTALVGTHADVEVPPSDLQILGVKEMRDTVRSAQLSPAGGRWQVILLEDADRLTEGAGNVLLKAVEEPAPRTVWLLCAPSIEDVLPTIRSRCRHLALRTPPVDAVADMLVRREGIEPRSPRAAARATQGHIDRARRLATDERARGRRAAVLKLPLRVEDIGGALKAAQELVDAAAEDAKQLAEEMDGKETEELRAALGAAPGRAAAARHGGRDEGPGGQAEAPRTRTQRDSLDLALTDLTGFYRDVLALQLGSRGGPRQRGRRGRRWTRLAAAAPRSRPCAGSRRCGVPRGARPQRGSAARGGGDDDGAASGLTPTGRGPSARRWRRLPVTRTRSIGVCAEHRYALPHRYARCDAHKAHSPQDPHLEPPLLAAAALLDLRRCSAGSSTSRTAHARQRTRKRRQPTLPLPGAMPAALARVLRAEAGLARLRGRRLPVRHDEGAAGLREPGRRGHPPRRRPQEGHRPGQAPRLAPGQPGRPRRLGDRVPPGSTPGIGYPARPRPVRHGRPSTRAASPAANPSSA